MTETSLFTPVHFQERHSRIISASPRACLDAVETFKSETDPLIRFCLGVRDLPGRLIEGHLAHRFSMESFTPLGRNGDSNVSFGLAGSFWRWDYGLNRDEAQGSRFWAAQGMSARLLLSFETTRLAENLTSLETRTQISCPDVTTRRKMAVYWSVIRPVSGLIRRRMLVAVAGMAEKY